MLSQAKIKHLLCVHDYVLADWLWHYQPDINSLREACVKFKCRKCGKIKYKVIKVGQDFSPYGKIKS